MESIRTTEGGGSGFRHSTGQANENASAIEHLENGLGRLYLSLAPLKDQSSEDRKDYQRAVGLLNAIAEKNGMRSPEEAARQPRAGGNIDALSNRDCLYSLRSWIVDGIVVQGRVELSELGGVFQEVFDRHGIANVNYVEVESERKKTVVDFKWAHRHNPEYTLAQVLDRPKAPSLPKPRKR